MAGLVRTQSQHTRVGVPIRLDDEDMDYAFDNLGAVILTAAAASIRFDFPTDYKVLFLDMRLIKDGTVGAPDITLNGDTGANYDQQLLSGSSTTVAGARSTGRAELFAVDASFNIAANGALTAQCVIAKQQSGDEALGLMSAALNGNANDPAVWFAAGIWNNTADLMSRLDITASATNFAAGTVAQLYGVR